MSDNQTAFINFKELLDYRRVTYNPDVDIREKVLSLTERKVGFGLVGRVLQSGFGANLPSLFSDVVPVDSSGIESCDAFIAHGTVSSNAENSHKGAVALYNKIPCRENVVLIETGFLATTHSWIHSSREKNPSYACLGYVYDDIAHYFMTDYPNRIIHKLNSDEDPSSRELARASDLIKRIVERRISKYNAQPMHAPEMTEGYSRRVLVCDQAYADASTVYGKVDEVAFEKMLIAAIRENPDAEILVKTHPDSSWEKSKRSGYYSHLSSKGRVRLLREPVNPYCIFELVDKVYVGTSQMGLEALFAGKEVVCFGAPFYAGWGLTDDRQKIPHRHRKRSMEELFYYFYIWYTIYHVPGCSAPSEIESVLDYIEANRPYPLPPTKAEVEAPLKVTVILPVYGVEDYIEDCLTSIQNQTLREIEIIPINDSSPDGSQEIIDRLAAQDPRIRPIVLSENIGQGFARNRGLEAARGEYIWFIDSDDWLVDREFLEKTVAMADKNCSDMTRARKAGEAIFDTNNELLRVVDDRSEAFFANEIERTSYAENLDVLHSRHFCLWLYRRSFIEANDIRFVTTQWEERAFLLKALLRSENLTLTTNMSFMYRIRQDSTARRDKGMKDVENFLRNIEQIAALLVEHGAEDRASELRQHLDFQISQFMHIAFFSFFYKTLMRECKEPECYLERLVKVLEGVKFGPGDLTSEPLSINKKMFGAGVYHLMISALLTRRFDLLALAVRHEAVPQDQLYALQLERPENDQFRELQAALNTYARNEMVKTGEGQKILGTQKPRVVVHIGATKTGSTYIQHFLEKNRPALLRAGVWFPEVGLFWQPTRPHKQAGHADFTRAALDRLPSLRDHIEAGLELMQGRVHTIVLSSEAFFLHQNSHRIAEYFSDYPVEMVVYLRRQDEWANAQYCEFVAGGAVGRVEVPFSEWLMSTDTQRRLDYRVPLAAWSSIIGVENVKARVFEKAQLHNHDLLADFAETIGLPVLLDLPQPTSDDRNAARLSASHVELIRLFNSRPFRDREAYFEFIEDVTKGLQEWREERALPTPKPWVLSAEIAEEIMQNAEAGNREVAMTYLGRVGEPLFGTAAAIPENVTLYPEEISLVSEAYERAKPKVVTPSKLKVSAPRHPSGSRSVTSAKNVRSTKRVRTKEIVNYGVFGWRYWVLTPALAMLYARRATPQGVCNFLREPAEFARTNWARRHPVMTGLLYPNADPMGPFKVFRIWIPVMKKLSKLSGRADLSGAIAEDPIRFARGMRNPIKRAIGRLMFPCGELR